MEGLHKKIQQTLLNLLPYNEARLEVNFPSIRRKADLFWYDKKIIFEIQCSPISLEEAQSRNSSYTSLGLSICWILHSKCFNKEHLTPAEIFLREGSCYYTNIGFPGPLFYDQYDILISSKRIFKSEPKSIDLSVVYRKQASLINHSSYFKRTLCKRKFYFKGDLLFLAQSKEQRRIIRKCEQETRKRLSFPQPTPLQKLLLPIKNIFNSLLRRYSI